MTIKIDAKPYVTIDRDEFIKKILSGERDFSGTKFYSPSVPGSYPGFVPRIPTYSLNECDGFKEMDEYLKAQDLEHSPLFINDADWWDFEATGMHMPYTRMVDSDFGRVRFRGFDLSHAIIHNTQLRETRFKDTDLSGATIEESDLGETQFQGNMNTQGLTIYYTNCHSIYARDTNFAGITFDQCNLTYALFENCDLTGACLENNLLLYTRIRDVKGFSTVKGMDSNLFQKVHADSDTAAIIAQAHRRAQILDKKYEPNLLQRLGDWAAARKE